MSSYKGRRRQPLDRVDLYGTESGSDRGQGPIPHGLAFEPSSEDPRHQSPSSGGAGRGPGAFTLRTSCSVLAAHLKSRIAIHRVEEFLEPYEPPSTFYRRFRSRAVAAVAGKTVHPLPSAKPSLIFLQRGTVELFIDCRRRPFVIARAVKGDVFGDAPLLGMSMLDSRARAVTDSRYISVPAEVIESAVLASHPLTIEWLRKVSTHHAELQDESIAVMFATVRQRLAALLLKLAENTGVISGVNHLAIAGRLGVYRETVS
ncbi:MAG: Crp/Fnr family transcriptional regulator, partial [Blastocatellia bacterium]